MKRETATMEGEHQERTDMEERDTELPAAGNSATTNRVWIAITATEREALEKVAATRGIDGSPGQVLRTMSLEAVLVERARLADIWSRY